MALFIKHIQPIIDYCLKRQSIIDIVKYIVFSSVGLALDVALYLLLIYLFDVHYFLAGLYPFLLATYVNYWLSIRFLFQEGVRFSKWQEILLIYGVSSTGLVWHQVALYLAVEYFAAHVVVAKMIAIVIAFIWNYSVRKYFVFHPGGNS